MAQSTVIAKAPNSGVNCWSSQNASARPAPSYLTVVDRLEEEYRPFAQQRCWVHKTANTPTNVGSDLSFF